MLWLRRCGGAFGSGARARTGLHSAVVVVTAGWDAAGVGPNGADDEAAGEVGVTVSVPDKIQEGATSGVEGARDGTRACETLWAISGIWLTEGGRGKSLLSTWSSAAAGCQPVPDRPRLLPLLPLPEAPLVGWCTLTVFLALFLPAPGAPCLHSETGCPGTPHRLHAWMRSALGQVNGPHFPSRIAPFHCPRLYNWHISCIPCFLPVTTRGSVGLGLTGFAAGRGGGVAWFFGIYSGLVTGGR